MLLLQPQGFRVVSKNKAIKIEESKKGNKYQRITAVPYLTNSDKGEATTWLDILLFGDDCIEDVAHNDFLLVQGRLESKYYMNETTTALVEKLEENEDFKSLNYQGRLSFSLLASSAKKATKEEIREAMGFGKSETSSQENNKPVANLEDPLDDEEELPF